MLTAIKNKVFTTFQAWFPAELYKLSATAVKAAEDARRKRENEFDWAELSVLVNKPVIAVGNDWGNPVIGIAQEVIGISQANNPRLIVKDYITGKEIMPFGAVMAYNDVRLEAIFKLTPAEITSLVYRHSTPQAKEDSPHKEPRESREAIMEKLTANGFFEAIKGLE